MTKYNSNIVLLLNYEFPPLGGGAGNATYYLLKEFAKRDDIEIDLVTSSVGDYKEEQFADNIKIYYLDIGKKGNVHYQTNKDLVRYGWKAYRLGQKLKKQKNYDLVHAFFGLPCGFIAKLLQLPYIVSLRGTDVPYYNKRYYWLDKLIFQYLSPWVWKSANSVVANSEDLQKLAQKTAPGQEIELIPNGVDTEEFHPLDGVPEIFTVISTSRLIERKGIRYLLEAFLEFHRQHQDSKLILAGQGNIKEKLKQQAQDAEAGNSVEFLGALDHQRLPVLYRRADVFVLPSLNEGMSNSLLEAMASGLAIIATDTGGASELVSQDNGIIIDKQDTDSIKNALQELYNGNQKLKQMKQASRQKAEAMSWQQGVENYLNIYKHNG